MADSRFRIAMIGGPVDGELSTMLGRGHTPATTIGVPQFHVGPMQVAWYDRLGTEALAGRWGYVYRETSGPEGAQRASTPARETAGARG